jgi:hypothetical protein
MHDRCVAYCQQQKGEESQLSLARAAEEAYIDLQEKKYAEIAMNAYAQADEFTKAAEFARITGSDKIRQFEALVKLMEQ